MLPEQPEPTQRNNPTGASPKLVVTAAEINAEVAPETSSGIGPQINTAGRGPGPRSVPTRASIPIWAVVLTCISALSLPILCFAAIGIRIGVRQRETGIREAWNRLLCTLLIISGLLTSLAFTFVLTFYSPVAAATGRSTTVSLGLRTLHQTQAFPQFPTAAPLNAEQIATQCKPLVFILAPDPGYSPSADYVNMAPIGAGTLLMANENGYLFCTSRHVVDEKSFPLMRRNNNRMLIFSHEGDYAPVEVVGRNRNLDIALLWEARQGAQAKFTQPIVRSSAIHTGQPVFVIGHPQRLFFTLSSGLVSRVEDPHILQFSAPISPGNSGGPVYDASGNLLGVVQSMVDRAQSPNAENLNFAVRAETLLSEAGWDFSGPGRTELDHLRQNQNKTTVPQDH